MFTRYVWQISRVDTVPHNHCSKHTIGTAGVLNLWSNIIDHKCPTFIPIFIIVACVKLMFIQYMISFIGIICDMARLYFFFKFVIVSNIRIQDSTAWFAPDFSRWFVYASDSAAPVNTAHLSNIAKRLMLELYLGEKPCEHDISYQYRACTGPMLAASCQYWPGTGTWRHVYGEARLALCLSVNSHRVLLLILCCVFK